MSEGLIAAVCLKATSKSADSAHPRDTHTHTQARTHAHARTHTHARAHQRLGGEVSEVVVGEVEESERGACVGGGARLD